MGVHSTELSSHDSPQEQNYHDPSNASNQHQSQHQSQGQSQDQSPFKRVESLSNEADTAPPAPAISATAAVEEQNEVETDPVLAIKLRRRANGGPTTDILPATFGGGGGGGGGVSSDDNDDDATLLEAISTTLVPRFESEAWPRLRDDYTTAIAQDLLDENGWYQGYRKITGGRYELKVSGEWFCETCSRWDHDREGSVFSFAGIPRRLVEYAERQAKRDERVQAMMTTTAAAAAAAVADEWASSSGSDHSLQEEPLSLTADNAATPAATPAAITRRQQQLTFADWSIIVSEDCEAQTIHVDVPPNNVQFGLILNTHSPTMPIATTTRNTTRNTTTTTTTGNQRREEDDNGELLRRRRRRGLAAPPTPGTKVVLSEAFGPYTVEDLVEGILSNAPSSLKECLLPHANDDSKTTRRRGLYNWVTTILSAFGPILQPRAVLEDHMVLAEEAMKKNTTTTTNINNNNNDDDDDDQNANHNNNKWLMCGDLICTSGAIPHAGPACPSFRMVMFGAASPSPTVLYDVDDQFFAHSAWLYLVQALWEFMDLPSKAWLLGRLVATAREYDPSIIDKHEETSPLLTAFMKDSLKDDDDDDDGGVEESVLIDRFLTLHGSKGQADLFAFAPPGLRDIMLSPS